MSEWTLRYNERPWTTNAERTWHHMKRAEIVKTWRNAYFYLTKEAGIPKLDCIDVEATPYLNGPGRNQDVAACNPAVKAALDGMVDAGVLPDDSPTYVRSIKFNRPVLKAAMPGLELKITAVEVESLF